MQMLRSVEMQRLWPRIQSLDLVKAGTPEVAHAVAAEVTRYTADHDKADPTIESRPLVSLPSALSAVKYSTNVPTSILVLPTNSDWTVLWNNSTLADGYDSLCSNLTSRFGFETVHWLANDEGATFQPGATFCFRRLRDGGVVKRSIHASLNDGSWTFLEHGVPLPEEDLANYRKRRIRDRFNEAVVMSLLARLGARPWSEEYYASGQPYFCVQRIGYSESICRVAMSAA
jgi:hypothetical protein